MLERAPQLMLAELKKGDALIISGSKAEGSTVTAIALVAGVEPFLAAAPARRASQSGFLEPGRGRPRAIGKNKEC